jgi:hypothetical protein
MPPWGAAAYARFLADHDGATPVRGPGELLAVIRDLELAAGELDTRFWDAVFESGWARDPRLDRRAVFEEYVAMVVPTDGEDDT